MLHHVTHQKQQSTDHKAGSLHGGMTNNTQYECAAVIQNLKNKKVHFRDTFNGSINLQYFKSCTDSDQ